MTEVVVVCEGQTEEVFVGRILAPALATRPVLVQPRLVRTSRHSTGGALTSGRVLRCLRNTLGERPDTYVTTFFDLYGLPGDFPGLSERVDRMNPWDQAAAIEAELHAAVIREADCRPDRFFPHIQPYEFESLLFADPSGFAAVEPAWQPFVDELDRARRSAGTPEHVNDGPNTHPSARLGNLLRPRYNKVRHGTAVSAEIGVDRIRAECRHFDAWLARIEAIPESRPGSPEP